MNENIKKILKDMTTNRKTKEREAKYWKLKQGNRIEYILHLKIIDDNYPSLLFPVLNAVFLVNIVLWLFATLFIIAFDSTKLVYSLPWVFKVSLMGIWIAFVLDIFRSFDKSKTVSKLRERFNLED